MIISTNLKWDDHVTAIASKAVKRLWFMKQLKRAGVYVDDLMYYYQSVVHPVLEYACPSWHPSLTKEQTKLLKTFNATEFRPSSPKNFMMKHT